MRTNILNDIDEYIYCPNTSKNFSRMNGGVVRREELKRAVATVFEIVTKKLGVEGVEYIMYEVFHRVARLNTYAVYLLERVSVRHDDVVDSQLISRSGELKLFVCHRNRGCYELIRERRYADHTYPYTIVAYQSKEPVAKNPEELKKKEGGDTGQFAWVLKPFDFRIYVGWILARWLFPDKDSAKAAQLVAKFYECLPHHPIIDFVYTIYSLGVDYEKI